MKNIGRILLFAALVCLTLGFCLGSAAFADAVQVGTWAELQAALNSASTDQTNPTALKLTADLTAGSNDGPLTVKSNTYVTLDLNGKTIDRGLNVVGSGIVVAQVGPDGWLTTINREFEG